jgi:hypothetical protein
MLEEVLAPRATDTSRGNEVLGQIFGSKDVSRAVAMNAASQTGQDPSMLKKLLPVLAMVVSGYMAKQQSGQRLTSAKSDGGLGTLLGGLLGGGQAAGSSSDDLGGLLNMGSNKRNPLDDIVGSPRV